MAKLEIRIKLDGDGLAEEEELSLRHHFQDEIERRGIGKDLGGGSGLGEMDISVGVTSDVGEAKSKLRELAEELGIKGGFVIEEYPRPSEIELEATAASDQQEPNPFGDLALSYSRSRAIEEGVLVDVSAIAKQAGIEVPVALTKAAFEEYVADLWDLVSMLQIGIEASDSTEDEVQFKLLEQDGVEGLQEVTLRAVRGHGDDGEPVITVMLSSED